MPCSYESAISSEQRLMAVASMLYRKDRGEFEPNQNVLLPYLEAAAHILQRHQPLILPYLELVVGTKCSLHCKHCSNLMQYYRPEQHITYELEELLRCLHRLLECVDYIVWFRILGGEPLLCSFLPDLMRHCLAAPQLGRVEIVTNGTIEPSADLLRVMSGNSRASFDFSNYGPVSRRITEGMALAQKACIRCSTQPVYMWENMGGMRCRSYTDGEVKNIYSRCDSICKTLMGEELHVCPRSANGMALGLVPRTETDYVSIFAQQPEETRKKIRALFDLDQVRACQYCNAPEARTPIPSGEQLPRGEFPSE